MGRIGGSLTRLAVLGGGVGLLLIVLWVMLYAALRLVPLAWAVISAALGNLADSPAIGRRIAAHRKRRVGFWPVSTAPPSPDCR